MLKVGQKLWYINKYSGNEEYVIVRDLLSDSFEVWYGPEGKHTTIKYSEIGTRVFLKSKSERERLKLSTKETKRGISEPTKAKTKVKLQHVSIRTGKPVQIANRSKSHTTISEHRDTSNIVFSNTQSFTPLEQSCNRCALQRSGECTSLENTVCNDFRAIPMIPKSERENYPQYGDASAIKRRDRKHFKD